MNNYYPTSEAIIINTLRLKGIFMATLGCIFWGLSGVSGQYLLGVKDLDPAWLSVGRMGCAGLLLLAYDAWKNGDIFAIWKQFQDSRLLLFFGTIGMMGTQYTYFFVIKMSNAAIATVIQYLMPVLIVFWFCAVEKRLPRWKEAFSVTLAVFGVALIATKGNFTTLSMSPETLIWGIASALFAAFYTVEPKGIIKKWRASLIVGWGLVIGSLTLLPVALTLPATGTYDTSTAVAFLFVVIFGTILSFTLYLGSLSYLEPGELSILAAIEPMASIVFSVLLFSMTFAHAELLGMLLIIIAVGIVTRK